MTKEEIALRILELSANQILKDTAFTKDKTSDTALAQAYNNIYSLLNIKD